MKLVFISDTHMFHKKYSPPKGDVLVHSGDFTVRGHPEEYFKFLEWLSQQPHKHKVFIAGNHDSCLENIGMGDLQRVHDELVEVRGIDLTNIHYLRDSGVSIDGINFWGSPVQPEFCDWSFQKKRGNDIRQTWDLIPENTDVLITHGPPYGHGDFVPRGKRHAGCIELLMAVMRIQPSIHCFGHIHEGYGWSKSDECKTKFINSSICNGDYEPLNKAIVVDI